MSIKLYGELAPDWYRLLSPLEGYEEEANDYQRILLEYAEPLPRTMLELGSGAGHVAYYLRQWYDMTLTDLSSQMLDLSREINPDCNHFLGDMRTLRLGETFDAVFIHDAIMYMLTPDDLRQAIETARIHCKPGGYILISPDDTAESFHPAVDQGGEDGGGRASGIYPGAPIRIRPILLTRWITCTFFVVHRAKQKPYTSGTWKDCLPCQPGLRCWPQRALRLWLFLTHPDAPIFSAG